MELHLHLKEHACCYLRQKKLAWRICVLDLSCRYLLGARDGPCSCFEIFHRLSNFVAKECHRRGTFSPSLTLILLE